MGWCLIKIGKYAISFNDTKNHLDIDGEWTMIFPFIFKNIGWDS